MQQFEKTVTIQASPATVWDALTNPSAMQQWMAEPETQVEVITDWVVGQPIWIRGFHHVQFENKGTVLAFELNQVLRYSHLSSISRLPDVPESYSIIDFRLEPLAENQTELRLTLENFPTDTIFKHLRFYWIVAVEMLKQFVEKQRKPGFHENNYSH